MDVDLRMTVRKLLAELDGPRVEDSLCTLRDLPELLPLVVEAYGCESDGQRRELLIHCLWQFRDAAALPTLAAALCDPDDRVWKEALDSIVTLGGDATLRVLEEARDTPAKTPIEKIKRAWIDEAIGQIHGNRDSARA